MKTCQPPHPDPRPPSFSPPAGACDSHCHVFGPGDAFPYHPKRSYTPPDAPYEALTKLHATLGLDRAVIVQATCHGDDNRAMLDAIARAGGRYRGVAMIDGSIADAELERLHEGGVRGVRMSFARHLSGPPDFSNVAHVAGRIAPLGWHLVLYLEAEDVVENADALGRLGVPVVIDHMARVRVADGLDQTPFRLLLDFLRDADFWVKISCAERLSAAGAPFADVVPFAAALIEAAPDRVLWGTDWPHPNIEGRMPDDGDLTDMLLSYAPDEELRRKVLVDNPARLYGFDA
ncbi:MAG: amidohydrolase family protein [Defluviicoccus sp.]|nr:amidohydrolase family protein [Defluviicoccus sp.]MDE0279071.1 amidohydrolase family protein [Defluviicoccus sp.]